jgi:hypothetical protein
MPKKCRYFNYKLIDTELNEIKFYKSLPEIVKEYGSTRQQFGKKLVGEKTKVLKHLNIEKVKIPALEKVEINLNHKLE